jgi:hypothetical protein
VIEQVVRVIELVTVRQDTIRPATNERVIDTEVVRAFSSIVDGRGSLGASPSPTMQVAMVRP